jgi:signal transduction histidine kinase
MEESLGRDASSMAPQWISWSSLWRGGLLALSVVFVLSTQLLFQFGLYEVWPLSDILLGWLDYFADQLIVGACIFAAVAAAIFLPAKSNTWKHAMLLASIALGALGGEILLTLQVPLPADTSAAAVLSSRVARWLVVAGLAYLYFVFRRQAAEAADKIHHSELQRIELDRQMTEARLYSLRAQIEPHFLFNTLANVQQLYRTDPGRGRKMLASFIAYLRSALPQMRHNETTLRHEVELARTYLDVLQVRMGERLKVSFDVPEELAELAFPPLALSTLTENAIKHGLNPLPEGGAIEITARIEGGQLRVSVADTGAGLRASGGTGAGVANLRARLAALYGEAAHLGFEANAPRGIRATIAVPVRTAPTG